MRHLEANGTLGQNFIVKVDDGVIESSFTGEFDHKCLEAGK